MSEIIDGFLFHGNHEDATNIDFLTSKGIKAIVNGLSPSPLL